jgi:hypothetical protein
MMELETGDCIPNETRIRRTTERMNTRSEPGLRAVKTTQYQRKHQQGPSDSGTGGWRLGSHRGEKMTNEIGERMKTRRKLGLRIEQEREGEERNDWKV